METMQYSQAYLRKRKMMMVLPVLVLPFITLAFWAVGGGKASAAGGKEANFDKGLNLQLPGADLKADKGLDKMSYYEMAAADSAKLKDRMRNDPFFKLKNSVSAEQDSIPDPAKTGLNNSPYNNRGTTDPNEIKIYKKLSQLNTVLDNVSGSSKLKEDKLEDYPISKIPPVSNQNVDRLEKMMQTLRQDSEGSDPEMTQINGMLEKILDIQHPDRINDNLRQNSLVNKEHIFPVTLKDEKVSGFYSLEDLDIAVQSQNAIEAVISETQTLVNGATVKLRLMCDVYIIGVLVPKDNFVYGTASLTGERLSITIKSIRYENSLLPVSLSVYDVDGMDGIYVPGAISRDVAKQSTDNALQSVGLNNLDPSIGMQAASVGIETAKNLISKKVKLIKVTVKAGYKVLLKDNNNKQ